MNFEELLRELRSQGHTIPQIIRGMRALRVIDEKPGVNFEKALKLFENADKGIFPPKSQGVAG